MPPSLRNLLHIHSPISNWSWWNFEMNIDSIQRQIQIQMLKEKQLILFRFESFDWFMATDRQLFRFRSRWWSIFHLRNLGRRMLRWWNIFLRWKMWRVQLWRLGWSGLWAMFSTRGVLPLHWNCRNAISWLFRYCNYYSTTWTTKRCLFTSRWLPNRRARANNWNQRDWRTNWYTPQLFKIQITAINHYGWISLHALTFPKNVCQSVEVFYF